MDKIRVLIADDSSLARALLRGICEEQPDIEIVGEAANGQQALELVQQLRPHLVTMDLEMPVMDGMQAIDAIMHSKAVPILVVSSVADAQNALEAVGCGALEVIAKPDYSPEQAAQFLAKVRMLAGVSVITRMRRRAASAAPAAPSPAPTSTVSNPPFAACTSGAPVFAMASSTGGPQALAQILAALPANFASPVLIAQHISDGFAQGMVDWLVSLCPLPVRLGVSGMPVEPGTVYISPSEQHLTVAAGEQLQLQPRTNHDVYHPCCDRLLHSAAQVYGRRCTGIILTGMGHDGAAGLGAIRAAGGATWAQDEASSIIFGMNRAAIERGVVQRILPLADMARAMQQAATVQRGL